MNTLGKCALCNLTLELSTCKCKLNICTSCFKSHQCTDPTFYLSKPENKAVLKKFKKDLVSVTRELENFSSRLSRTTLNSNFFSNVEMKNLIFLACDFDPQGLPQYVVSTQNTYLNIYDIINNNDSVIDLRQFDKTIGSSVCYNSETFFIVAGLVDFVPTDRIICINKKDPNNVKCLTLKHARFFCASVCLGQYLVVIGGIDDENNALKSIECFDLENDSKFLFKMKKPRGKPSVACVKKKIFIAGNDSESVVEVLDMMKFKLVEKTLNWVSGEIFMVGCYCGELIVIDEVGVSQENSEVVLRMDKCLRDMWSQQVLVGLDSFLYFVDYYSGNLIRIYVAELRKKENKYL